MSPGTLNSSASNATRSLDTADPFFYCEFGALRKAKERLYAAVDASRGLTVILGDPGTGKTSLSGALEQELLADDKVVLAKILDPAFATEVEFLIAIGRVFGLTLPPRSRRGARRMRSKTSSRNGDPRKEKPGPHDRRSAESSATRTWRRCASCSITTCRNANCLTSCSLGKASWPSASAPRGTSRTAWTAGFASNGSIPGWPRRCSIPASPRPVYCPNGNSSRPMLGR